MQLIVGWLVTNLLTNTSVMIGLITLVGLVAARRPFEEVVAGFLKTVLGWLVFMGGIQIFIPGLNLVQQLVNVVFHAPPVKFGSSYITEFAHVYGPVIVFSYLVHLLAERFIVPEKYRYVYLDGHFLLRVSMYSTGLALMLSSWKAPSAAVIAFGTIVASFWWTFQPAYMRYTIEQLRGDKLLGYAHQSSSAAWLTSKLAKFVGRPEDSAESIEFPKRLGFLKEVHVATATAFLILLVTLGCFAGRPALVEAGAGNMDPYVWLAMQALQLGAGFSILIYGIRIMMAEILPAFEGIASRIVPGARPAMDVPTVFPYSPIGSLVGAMASLATFFTIMVIFAFARIGYIYPSVPCLFMSGAGVGVFGNKFGGRRGAILGGILVGLILALGQYVVIHHLAPSLVAVNYQIGFEFEPDDFLLFLIIYPVAKLLFGRFAGV